MYLNYRLNEDSSVCNDDYNNVIALIHSVVNHGDHFLRVLGAGTEPTQPNEYFYTDVVFRGKAKTFDPEFLIDQLKEQFPNSDFVLYADSQPHRYHLIVGFDEPQSHDVTEHDIAPHLRSMVDNILGDTGKTLKNQNVTLPLTIDLRGIPQKQIWDTVPDDRDALAYPITDLISTTDTIQTHRRSDEEQLTILKRYLDETQNTLNYGDSLERLLISIARYKGDSEPFLKLVQQYTQRDVKKYYDHVKNSRKNVPSLDQFYIMPDSDRESELGVFLLKQTGVVPNEDATIDSVFHVLQHTFQWGINTNLEGATGYSDGLLIFDPRVGYWVNDPNIVKNLVQTVRPYTKDVDVDRIRDQLTTYSKNNSLTISPYAGSRYILFDDCVLDVKTMTQLSLDSDYVKQLKFTERSHIRIPFKPDAPNVKFSGHRAADGGVWTPEDFISGYAGNDPDVRDYLLFCLCLSLFSGHNFGVTVDIQGSSGWGKTTLSRPLLALHRYNHEMTFHDINDRFPFTNYHPETAMIWMRECNTDSNRLTSSGTSLYDTLCDEQARFQVKQKNDITIAHPPTVYVDGTSLIHADDLGTGPSRRTLPICLPKNGLEVPKKDPRYDVNGNPLTLQQQIYDKSINDDLMDPRVLQYLVSEMIKSYRRTVNLEVIDDLKINLNQSTNDLHFPPQVEVWRKQFVASSNEIHDWFVDDIYPCLSLSKDGTLMHTTVLYAFYKEWHKAVFADSSNYQSHDIVPQPKFEALLEDLYREFNLDKVEAGQMYANYNKPKKRVVSLRRTGFRVDQFKEFGTGKIPSTFNGDHPDVYPFHSSCTGWYHLYMKDDVRQRLIQQRDQRESEQALLTTVDHEKALNDQQRDIDFN